jgi:hypothetical protein
MACGELVIGVQKAFCTPITKWRARCEEYGNDDDLTLVIDGSPLYAALNGGDADVWDQLDAIVHSNGCRWEMGYAWSVHFAVAESA